MPKARAFSEQFFYIKIWGSEIVRNRLSLYLKIFISVSLTTRNTKIKVLSICCKGPQELGFNLVLDASPGGGHGAFVFCDWLISVS